MKYYGTVYHWELRRISVYLHNMKKKQNYLGYIVFSLCALLAIQCTQAPDADMRAPVPIAFSEVVDDSSVKLTATFDHTGNLSSAGFEVWQVEGEIFRKEGEFEGKTLSALLTGLKSETEYSYAVFYGNGEEVRVSEAHSFRTLAAPEPGTDPQPGQDPEPDPEPQQVSPDLFDPALWRFLVKNHDADGDGVMSDVELENILDINLCGVALDTLKGLELLSNLESLSLGDNTLSHIDVSNNKKLQFLSVMDERYLEGIVLDNPALFQTYFVNIPCLKHLDVSKCPEMYICEWWEVSLEGTVDFSNCPNLHALRFGGTNLVELDLSSNHKLLHLNAPDNPELKTIWLWEKIRLESLEVDPQVEIKYKK